MSCSILYTWITSALSLLYSNEGNPNARSLSLYGKCDIHLTSFVARLCTFSKAILSFLKTGDHTGACNHRIGPDRTGSEVITGSDLILH